MLQIKASKGAIFEDGRMKTTVCLVVAALTTALAANAQEIEGGVTLDYSMIDSADADTDLSAAGLDGRLRLRFENGASVGMQVGRIDVGIDGVPFDFVGGFIGLDAGYRFSSGASVGAYVEELSVGIDALPDDLSIRAYGLSAAYDMEGLDLGAFAGRSSTDPDLGIDVTNYGLTATYTALPAMTFGGAYLNATLESGGEELDIGFTGIAATYAVTDAVMAFGGFSRSSIDLADVDIDTMGLGVGYDLAQVSGVSSTVSLEIARTTLSSGGFESDLDTVRLGLTFPFGKKGTALPTNSVADSVLNPRHGALNAALTSAF